MNNTDIYKYIGDNNLIHFSGHFAHHFKYAVAG
jgi:hypothetical protein